MCISAKTYSCAFSSLHTCPVCRPRQQPIRVLKSNHALQGALEMRKRATATKKFTKAFVGLHSNWPRKFVSINWNKHTLIIGMTSNTLSQNSSVVVLVHFGGFRFEWSVWVPNTQRPKKKRRWKLRAVWLLVECKARLWRCLCASEWALFGTVSTQATMTSRPQLAAQGTGPPPISWDPDWTLLRAVWVLCSVPFVTLSKLLCFTCRSYEERNTCKIHSIPFFFFSDYVPVHLLSPFEFRCY